MSSVKSLFFASYLTVCGVLIAGFAHAQTSPPSRPDNLRLRLGSPPTVSRFLSAMEIISTKCAGCHQAGGAASNFKPYLGSEQGWVDANYVVPGQSQQSLLFKYLKGSGFTAAPLGTMPIGNTLTAAELLTIRNWIDQMTDPIDDVATPTPTPIIRGEVLLTNQNYLRLGDRFFMASVFEGIFGPAARPIITGTASTPPTATTAAVNGTMGMVAPMISKFGGSCDQMYWVPSTGTITIPDKCVDVEMTAYYWPTIPSMMATRAGSTMKACNVLAFNNTTIQYAIRLATKKTDLAYLTTTPIPTNAEIINAYNLFFPGAFPPPQGVITALTNLANVVKNPTASCPASRANCQFDPWRYVILSLCYDPAWQVL